ncbi:DUF6521 family protein [Dickeya dianthicola]|uniref:three component ABC system middle component n=1 Tax=Enterobacterales TaxID=91347 RepID=UPI0018D8422E|nr:MULTISPECIES: three component ABC system middle component [Enterobacterales]MCI4032920.1 DUF6521 family protein [Dickeya dianthicola]MCI4174444.1 DUF6521 family protein [Dickeya dianthicola]MCI4179368.1 DUF6521 family protein [Dickeya dianthicola]MCI4180482.1 DUF6521 family protein [Dickeya dianthicola]MCI4196722.1 DUF6521 family protein [Dickeya dianthicola]
MSGIIDSLYQLKYNPFKFSEYFVSFYSSLNKVENNLILAPLVIPLCTHSIFQTKIQGAVFGDSKKSTMWSIFNDRAKFYDLQERLEEFKHITAQSIQHCLINDWLIIDTESLTLYSEDSSKKSIISHKSAISLAKLFSNHSVIEIFDFFGVKPQ